MIYQLNLHSLFFFFLLLPSPFYFKFRTDLDPCSRRFRHRVEQSIIIVLMSRSELSPSLSKFMNLWCISTQHPTSLITTRGYWREARRKPLHPHKIHQPPPFSFNSNTLISLTKNCVSYQSQVPYQESKALIPTRQ